MALSTNSAMQRHWSMLISPTPPATKKPLAPSGKSAALSRAVPRLHEEGRSRDRHERWVRDAMDALGDAGERR
jgi:hypothetical protein